MPVRCTDIELHAKDPNKESLSWFSRSGEAPSTHEVLFYALLLCVSGISVERLEEWCKEVLTLETSFNELGAAFKLPTKPEWLISGKKVGSMLSPMNDAYNGTWTEENLERIGAAMQACRGPGRVNGLSPRRLKSHKAAKLLGEKQPGSKNAAPARWRTAGILIGVARRVKGASGIALRKLLKLDVPLAEVPTIEMELAEAQAEAMRVPKLVVERDRARDSHRKAQARAKTKCRAATDARKAKRRKLAGVSKQEVQKRRKQAAAARVKIQAAEAAKAAAKVAADMAAMKVRLAKARKRARDAEGSAKLSGKRLKRAQTAERNARNLQAAMEEMADREEEEGSDDGEPAESSRRDARGRFKALPDTLRVLVWSQLGRRVAPTTVHANISDAIGALAPEEGITLPCERSINKMRGELTIASEAIAAFRVALCKRIVSFGWDESSKFGLGLLSSNTQIETHTGEIVDVVMRGATLTAGATAEAVAWSIDKKIFTHARRLLAEWRDAHEKRFGAGSWAAAGGPAPGSLGLNRLTENTLLMSDTCNAARKCKRLVAEAALASLKEKIGEAAWDALSEEERADKGKVYVGHCHAHLRNIIINAMSIKATESLNDTLADSLEQFSSFDRMSVDGNNLIRVVFKELHEGGEYAKGKGREFWAWVRKHYPSVAVMNFVCANGSRQDIAFDGAVPIFVNRTIILEFLRSMMLPGASNQLERFLWRVLSCNEMTALLRVNTLWKYTFSEPARWLSGKASKLKGWSIERSSGVLDVIEKAMMEIAADGRKLLDPTFDPFKSIADEQQLFREWRDKLMQRTAAAHDGSTHTIHADALAEARSPQCSGNQQATGRVVALAEQMANAALVAMRDPRRAIASLLVSQDGADAVGKDASKHEATTGAHVTNCRVESNFGCVDILMRMYRYATVENISGVAQQMRNQDFERPPKVDEGRGRKRKQELEPEAQHVGFFYAGLTPELQSSLIEYARHAAIGARSEGRLALKAHDEEKLERRADRLQTLLTQAVERYAYALELFDAWAAQRERGGLTKAAIKKALLDDKGKDKPEAQKLEYLRVQIEMRVLGLGWSEYATRWSSKADDRVGSVAHLHTLLEEIVDDERGRARFTAGSERGLPTEAAPPQTGMANVGQLGTADADAMAVSAKAVFSAAELRKKADAERQRRVEAGIADGVEALQPDEAPAFDEALVGKRLEVLWKYHDALTKEPHLIWATGRVTQIADGVTHKRSAACKKILPAGAVLWAWDADAEFDEAAGEQWLILLPKKWKKQQVYSWRYDPRELSPAAAAPARDERRRNATRVEA